MNAPALIMALVAALGLAAATVLATRRVRTEAGVYGRRIATTMLFALSAMLAIYAYALWSWGPVA